MWKVHAGSKSDGLSQHGMSDFEQNIKPVTQIIIFY
jgi:hypothetical protein